MWTTRYPPFWRWDSYAGAACFHFTAALSFGGLSLHFSPEVLSVEVDQKVSLASMGSREPYITSACWGKANFLQNFPQLESRPYTNNFLRGQKMLFPIRQAEQNRIQSLTFSVLPMKRQLLCQGDAGEQSELSPLQEIEVAISARQFATSLAVSVQLCCEMSLAVKPKQLFFSLLEGYF